MAAETTEGIEIEPVYTRESHGHRHELPGVPPYRRGRTMHRRHPGWDIGWKLEGAKDIEPEELRQLLDLDTRLFEVSVCPGRGFADALATLVASGSEVCMAPGAHAICLPGQLARAARVAEVPLTEITGSFGLDPIGLMARTGDTGSLERRLAVLRDIAAWSSEHTPRFRSMTIDARVYHEAGAHAAQELACAIATGIHYLRTLTPRMSPREAAARMGFSVAISGDFFMEVAKLRAARVLWSNVLRHAGAGDNGGTGTTGAHILVHSSARMITRYERWTNILREANACFAAVTGGADGIILHPFDQAIRTENRSRAARRLALTTQHVLAEEVRAGAVQDAAGGSWYVERLTDQLAERAWELVRDIERRGGIEQCLLEGYIQSEIARTSTARRTSIRDRKTILVGINVFLNRDERSADCPAVESEGAGRPAPMVERTKTGGESAPDPTPAGKLSAWIATRGLDEPGTLDACSLEPGEPGTVEPLIPARDALELEQIRDGVEDSSGHS